MLKLRTPPWKRHFVQWQHLFPILVFVILAAGASAQNSQISGVVDHTSKARIQGATISFTHTETGERREVVSNAEGYFVFPLFASGTLRVARLEAGF